MEDRSIVVVLLGEFAPFLFISTLGSNSAREGMNHLAFEWSNISETLGDFERAGVPVAGTTPTKEVLSIFLHPKFAHGVVIQVLKKGVFDSSGRMRREMMKKH